ncbi:MAG TPA: SH3 domain-containing protein, partial [Thermomicrobiales bacterium]|nr:SH3 domain-containing protein [Thermomicrobiales bacterium]
MSGAPLRRRQGFLSWLTVLIVLTGSLSWVPVFAGDVPESPDPSLSSVSLSCLTPSSTISGSLSVADPAESVVVSVALQAGDNVLDTAEVTLNAGQTSYDLTFDLEGGDLALGSSVRAVATFVSGGSSIESATRSIGEYQGAVVCVPDGGLPSVPTVEPSAEPTQPPPSPIPTTTPSPSPEPGASVTPSPEPTGVPSATPTTPATGTGTVVNTAGANLNCRATPATGTIVAKLPAGSTVSVTGATQNGWVPVTCGGQAGWVSAQYLSIAAGGTASPTPTTPPTSSSYVTVTGTGGDNLRCRTAPVSGATITLMAP